MSPSRRHVLAGAALALAGCAGGPDAPADGADSPTAAGEPGDSPAPTESSGSPDPSDSPASTTRSGTPTDAAASATTAGELDLREANVTGVEFERDGRSYRLSVTLYHDDDGEDGYANWWQVETTGGERWGRRDLLHAHGTREFTRSETVEIPAGTACVVVRGHDQTHGYGGQAMLVNLESGETRAVRQGSEPRSFDATACP